MRWNREQDEKKRRRVLAVLADGAFHSVRDIRNRSGVPDVNRIVFALRDQGLPIHGRRRVTSTGRVRWYFRLPRSRRPSSAPPA